jgi:hypothetical protein
METILRDFDKLLATVKNPKNNIYHFDIIDKMISFFELKYAENYRIQNHLLVMYLRKELEQQINILLKIKT